MTGSFFWIVNCGRSLIVNVFRQVTFFTALIIFLAPLGLYGTENEGFKPRVSPDVVRQILKKSSFSSNAPSNWLPKELIGAQSARYKLELDVESGEENNNAFVRRIFCAGPQDLHKLYWLIHELKLAERVKGSDKWALPQVSTNMPQLYVENTFRRFGVASRLPVKSILNQRLRKLLVAESYVNDRGVPFFPLLTGVSLGLSLAELSLDDAPVFAVKRSTTNPRFIVQLLHNWAMGLNILDDNLREADRLNQIWSRSQLSADEKGIFDNTIYTSDSLTLGVEMAGFKLSMLHMTPTVPLSESSFNLIKKKNELEGLPYYQALIETFQSNLDNIYFPSELRFEMLFERVPVPY